MPGLENATPRLDMPMEQDQIDSPPDRPELSPRMILTCPRCATRYFVDPTAVPSGGRSVRCAACGDSWRAVPEPEVEVVPVAPLDLEPSAAASVAGPALPKAFRAKVEAQRRTRNAMTAGAGWAALGAALAMIIVAAVVLRREIVHLWPRTAGAYAALHLPVNPTGLSLDTIEGAPGLEDGRAVMVVTGIERNVDADPRRALPVRVSLFDRAGHAVATRVVVVTTDVLPPGETRAFRAVFPDPPLATAEIGAEFAFSPTAAVGGAAKRRALRASPSARPTLRVERIAPLHPASNTAPAVVDAHALPADSPYALTPHG